MPKTNTHRNLHWLPVCIAAASLLFSPFNVSAISSKHSECVDGATALVNLVNMRADGWTSKNLKLEISKKTHLSEKTKSRLEGFIDLPLPIDSKERKLLVDKNKFDWAATFYLSCSD